jgi:nucleoside-diphosphate-sugar epimerase
VTGGAGFLGSHLCKLLLRNAYDVLCVDNLYTGTKRNILSLLDEHNGRSTDSFILLTSTTSSTA